MASMKLHRRIRRAGIGLVGGVVASAALAGIASKAPDAGAIEIGAVRRLQSGEPWFDFLEELGDVWLELVFHLCELESVVVIELEVRVLGRFF